MIGTISESSAKNEFIEFIDEYDEWKHMPEVAPLGYRLDTWQLWVNCDSEDHQARYEKTGLPCLNPGLHIEVEAPDEYPFAVYLGPYVLFREKRIQDAFMRMTQEATPRVLRETGHVHFYGTPHHPTCEVCILDAQNPPPEDGGPVG